MTTQDKFSTGSHSYIKTDYLLFIQMYYKASLSHMSQRGG